jgi:hypothetical protein
MRRAMDRVLLACVLLAVFEIVVMFRLAAIVEEAMG